MRTVYLPVPFRLIFASLVACTSRLPTILLSCRSPLLFTRVVLVIEVVSLAQGECLVQFPSSPLTGSCYDEIFPYIRSFLLSALSNGSTPPMPNVYIPPPYHAEPNIVLVECGPPLRCAGRKAGGRRGEGFQVPSFGCLILVYHSLVFSSRR